MIHVAQSAQFCRSKMGLIHIRNHENNVPLGYHYDDFVATYALGYMMYGRTFLVPMKQKVTQQAEQGA